MLSLSSIWVEKFTEILISPDYPAGLPRRYGKM